MISWVDEVGNMAISRSMAGRVHGSSTTKERKWDLQSCTHQLSWIQHYPIHVFAVFQIFLVGIKSFPLARRQQ